MSPRRIYAHSRPSGGVPSHLLEDDVAKVPGIVLGSVVAGDLLQLPIPAAGRYLFKSTQSEAADLLNVDRRTVYRWIKNGKLQAERVGGAVLINRVAIKSVHRNRRGRRPNPAGGAA